MRGTCIVLHTTPHPALRVHPAPSGEGNLTFFAGNGGVGKTTCSAADVLKLAATYPEKQHVVISVDPAHSLRDVLPNQQPPPNLQVETKTPHPFGLPRSAVHRSE
jgi:arsenite-transporting ATPase